jgi:hypothetical protein
VLGSTLHLLLLLLLLLQSLPIFEARTLQNNGLFAHVPKSPSAMKMFRDLRSRCRMPLL